MVGPRSFQPRIRVGSAVCVGRVSVLIAASMTGTAALAGAMLCWPAGHDDELVAGLDQGV
jgi:hypothetical protein